MTREDIEGALRADGFSLEAVGAATWRTSFRSEARAFPLYVSFEKAFLCLAVVPFGRLPMETERADALMDRLLRLNRDINLAKLSVDDDGDVVLSVEYRLADLDPSELRDALDAITFYAQKHWPEVSPLSG